jgi:hypothetical protein
LWRTCAQTLLSGFPLAGSEQTCHICGNLRLKRFLSYSAKGESTIHLLSHLYAQRAFELWKVPEVAEWLRSSIDATLLKRLASETSPVRTRARNAFEDATPEFIVRHVIVAENQSSMAFLSPNAVPRTMVSYDPVPPRTSLTQYDEAYFLGVTVGQGRRRRDPAVHQRPPPGDEEELVQVQEMIMQEIRRRAAGDVPGAFPGQGAEPPLHEGEVDSEIEESEGEDDDDDRDLVSRLFASIYHDNRCLHSLLQLGGLCKDCTTFCGEGVLLAMLKAKHDLMYFRTQRILSTCISSRVVNRFMSAYTCKHSA